METVIAGRGFEAAGAIPFPPPRARLPESPRFEPQPIDGVSRSESAVRKSRPLEATEKAADEARERLEEGGGPASEALSQRRIYGLYDVTQEIFLRIIDLRTQETLKTIPAEEYLQLRASFAEALGLFLDEEA